LTGVRRLPAPLMVPSRGVFASENSFIASVVGDEP
jgi:hypothetical protein